MRKCIAFILTVAFTFYTTPLYALPPKGISTFETVATQIVTEDDLTAPYSITGESIVNVIHSMVDFDIAGSSVVFNRHTGQVFVKQTPSNHITIENIIGRLRRITFKQIDIEARLVTVEANDFKGIGVDLGSYDFISSDGERKFGTEIPRDTTVSNTFTDFSSFANALDDTIPGGQFTFGVFNDIWDIDILIDALESRTEVNTLANPRLTVFNNQRAHLKIERRENYISEIDSNFTSTSTFGGSGVVSVFFQTETIVRQAESGTILDVTPTVNSDGTIGLDLHPHFVTADLSASQTFTNVVDSTEFPNTVTLPVFTSQTIDTYLTIPNGGVVVLGGLITEEEDRTFQKVPFFGDIPWIGKLFFTQEKIDDTKQYLLIFIKAKVKELHRS